MIGENFPYTNFHDMNLDWMIKIAKDFLDQYTQIQQTIENGETSLENITSEGLQQLQDKADTLEGLLNSWYTEHSEDIAEELAEALSTFNTEALEKAAEVIASIPDDYTDLSNNVTGINDFIEEGNITYFADIEGKYINSSGTESNSSEMRCSDYIRIPDDAYGFQMYVLKEGTQFSPVCAFYDDNKNFLSTFSGNDHVSGVVTVTLARTSDVKYVRFNQSAVAGDQASCFFRFMLFGWKYVLDTDYIPAVAISADLDSDSVDIHNLEPNKMYYRYTLNHSPANIPYYDWTGNMITVYGSPLGSYNGTGMRVIALGHDGRIFTCDKWGPSEIWSDWAEIGIPGKIGTAEYQFTSSREVRDTGIFMKPNHSYRIINRTPITKRMNIWGKGNTSNVVYLLPGYNEVIFKNDNSNRQIDIYNINYNADKVILDVYDLGSIADRMQQDEAVYIVQKEGYISGSYTSLTQCLLDLKDDETPKTIYIEGGDYNIFQEYTNANVPVYTGADWTTEYYDYCVWVPKNTHIIGRGRVRLIWEPDASDVTIPQSKTVSPLNVAANCIIENIQVICKNGRYCLHNDALGMPQFYGARQIFKDCIFIKNQHDTKDGNELGFRHTIGFGIDSKQYISFENCSFFNNDNGRAFYGHTRLNMDGATITKEESGQINCTNCNMVTNNATECVKLGNLGDGSAIGLQIITKFLSCYFSSAINVTRESGDTDYYNAFDITALNCHTPTINVTYADNPYTPKIYN